MAHCVSLNNKELISMSKQLDIDVNQLALNIQLYQDKNDTYDFPTIEYLKESLGISGLSKTEYSSKEKYETSLKLWEELYKNTINFKDDKLASEMYLKTLQLFNKDDVFLNKKLDGSYDLIVLKPQEKQDILLSEYIVVFPLKGNEQLYKDFRLLTVDGKIQPVNPNTEKTRERLATLNLSTRYSFVLRPTSDGKHRIFITNKFNNSTKNKRNQPKESGSVLKDRYFKDSNTVKASELLDKISKSKHSLSKLAEKLLPYILKSDIDVSLVDTFGKDDDSSGKYYSKLKSIDLNSGVYHRGSVESTILHEVIHSLTHSFLRSDDKILKDFTKLFEYVKSVVGDEYYYGLTSLDEFITEMFTDSLLVERLLNIKPLSNVNKYDNIFVEFWNLILSLFEINKNNSVYEQAMSIGSNIIDLASKEDFNIEDYMFSERNTYDVLLSESGELIDDIKEDKQEQDVYEKDIFGDITEETKDFYNNDILTSSDRGYLARQAIVQLSELVDSLQKGTFELTPQEVKEEYFNNEFEDIDFSTMERFDIIKRITLIKLLDVVKERKFNPIISEYILNPKEEQQLQLAYDNFYALVKLAYHKLLDSEQLSLNNKQLTDLEDIENIDNIEDIIDGIIDGLSEKESWQRGVKHISVKDSLSPEIKRELSKIKELDEEGKPIIDKYGMNKIIDPDIIYNTILKTVSSFLNIEDMENALKINSSINPWMSEVIKLIKNEPFRSKFFQNFRKDNIQYSIIIREKKKDGYVYKIKKLNSSEYSEQLSDALLDLIDENNLNVVIESELKDEKIISKLNKKLIAKNITIINNLFNSVISKINNISESEYLSFVKNNLNTINDLLNDVGIIIPIEILNKFLENNISQNNKFTRTNASLLLGKLDLLLKELNKEEIDNIEFVKHTTGFYKNIANLFTDYVVESSDTAVYQSGKLYQSYVTPSSLGKLIINLKNKNNKQDTQKVLDFIKKEFLQFDWFYNKKKEYIFPSWLRLLNLNNQRGDDARNVLEHKVQLEFNGVNYVDLSPLEYLTALLQEYTLAPKGTAWFHTPIFSDKPSAEFIKFYKYDKTGDVTKELSNLFFQELNRIKTVLDRINKNDIEYITNYDIVLSQELKDKKKSGKRITFDDILKLESSKRGGSEFKFLDFFNNPINEKIKRGIIENITDENTENLILNEIIEEIDINLNKNFENTVKVWEKLGLFEIDKNTKKYKHIPNYGNDITEVYNNLKKYYYNSYLATANIIQLTVTDIAFYKNVEDFQKRFAQLHSPALRLNVNAVDSNGVKYSKDGVEKTIYLKDNEIMSLFKKEILKIFDDKIKKSKLKNEKLGLTKLRDEISKKLDEINSTDAQAFNSLTGLRKKLGMSGKWYDASQKAYDSIKSGNWTLEDTNVLWQPLKPFVYTLLNKSGYSKYTDNIKVPVQNKNSEYLLFIASVIANDNSPKLKAIFDFMEENDIDTVQFESAVKSGKQGVIDINNINSYDNIKNYLENKILVKSENGNKMYNEQTVHQIPFEDYGIQQNVPSHIVDTTQGVGSQIRKLIISDISNDATFNIDGKEYTKLELIDLYSNLIKANVDESLNELYKELGFNENGEIIDKKEQNKMLSSLLIEEARKNGRYGPDTIRSFELNEDGDFMVPLNDLTNSYRIQQLLNSIIKSRITKQVSNGGSAVQLSSYGLNKDLKIVFNEDGSIKYFEAYITVFSEKLKELLLDYDINGNPYYNIDKKVNDKFVFPEEARKILGYRIPTEDKYSMTPIYIKGFLPEQSGGAIMLPHEITLLSGSDKRSMFDPL